MAQRGFKAPWFERKWCKSHWFQRKWSKIHYTVYMVHTTLLLLWPSFNLPLKHPWQLFFPTKDQLTLRQSMLIHITHPPPNQKRASEKEDVTYWLQGNYAKQLITAVPANLNLSKKIPSSQCLIALDGSWSLMHDNVCVTLLPACVHSCQPSLQVMSAASLTMLEGKRGGERSQTQSNVYQPSWNKGIEHHKMNTKGWLSLQHFSFIATLRFFFKWSICDLQHSNWQASILLLNACWKLHGTIWITTAEQRMLVFLVNCSFKTGFELLIRKNGKMGGGMQFK